MVRQDLQKTEALWRQKGALVLCDQLRDGLWLFRPQEGADSAFSRSADVDFIVSTRELLGITLSLTEDGQYQPANLARSKSRNTTSGNAPSNGSSPSSALDRSIRNAQSHNARALQANRSLNFAHDAPTRSPTVKEGAETDEAIRSQVAIHEAFISAVLNSITYRLCHDNGFVPLNPRTLVVPSASPSKSGFKDNVMKLASLDISLSSMGTLIVKVSIDLIASLLRCDAILDSQSSFADTASGTAVWLAPIGHPAKFHCLEKQSDSLAISRLDQEGPDFRHPNDHTLDAAATMSWKTTLLAWLDEKGLDSGAVEEGGWVVVRTVRRDPLAVYTNDPSRARLNKLIVVPWPALLCFQSRGSAKSERQKLESYLENWRDPLSLAEEWFMGKDERANTMAKRQKEREAAEVLSKDEADAESHISKTNMLSATALRRGSNAGAMYPTPPDAIQSHNIGVTPSMDGAGSTPGNAQVSAHDTMTVLDNGAAGTDTFGSDGSILPPDPSINLNNNDNDNLFGEVEADMFVDTDITDADFSFFDQPDDLGSDLQLDEVSTAMDTTLILTAPKEQENDLKHSSHHTHEASNQDSPDMSHFTESTNDFEDNKKNKTLTIPSSIDQIRSGRKDQEETEFRKPLIPKTKRRFDKEAVYCSLVQNQGQTIPKQMRRISIFGKVNFKEILASVNEKYSLHGRFQLPLQSEAFQTKVTSAIPETDYMKTRRKSRASAHMKLAVLKNVKDAGLRETDPASAHGVHSPSESDASSLSSDLGSPSPTTPGPLFMFNPGIKRKRDNESDLGDDIKTPIMSAHDPEQSFAQPIDEQLPFLEDDRASWSLTPFFTIAGPDLEPSVLPDLEYIATAQILADQALFETLRLPTFSELPKDSAWDVAAMHRNLMHTISNTASLCFKDVSHCRLRSFLEIPGVPIVNLRLLPRPTPNPRSLSLDTINQNNPFQLPAPHLDVRRSDSHLSILPSAIPFWENLGLGPSTGSKDVCAVCVYPNIDGVAERANRFLDQMRSFYESYRFGSHERARSDKLADSILPFNITPTQQPHKLHHLTMLKEAIARLSNVLLSMQLHHKNIVVYFIYPVGDPTFLIHSCCAFKHLLDIYRLGLAERRMTTRNELVLQLIPLDLIASPTYIPMPTPSEYGRIAMEVYDRCVEFATSASGPAILLEKASPKNIDFKLTSKPSPSLLHENTCLHVAYAQSLDERWITAAWTDNRGNHQMTASYSLGRKNQPLVTPFFDVANEIWETTLDVIRSIKVHWRVFIIKVGVMEPHEFDTWKSFKSLESHPNVNLTLVTIQTNPSLRLIPGASTSSPPPTSVPAIPTPVSTPQTTGQSTFTSTITTDTVSTPTREALPGTPIDAPGDADTDARLVDLTDQTWGAILSHRLNNSNSLLDMRPALVSGYLIKRGGVESSDAPIVLEVNIIHSGVVGNPRTFHESLLRELLGYYRGLATLARVRGVVDPVRDGRPWHVAAAEKGVKALYTCM